MCEVLSVLFVRLLVLTSICQISEKETTELYKLCMHNNAITQLRHHSMAYLLGRHRLICNNFTYCDFCNFAARTRIILFFTDLRSRDKVDLLFKCFPLPIVTTLVYLQTDKKDAPMVSQLLVFCDRCTVRAGTRCHATLSSARPLLAAHKFSPPSPSRQQTVRGLATRRSHSARISLPSPAKARPWGWERPVADHQCFEY